MKRVLFLIPLISSLSYASDDWGQFMSQFCSQLGKETPGMWNAMSEGQPFTIESMQKVSTPLIKSVSSLGTIGVVAAVAIPAMGIGIYHVGNKFDMFRLGSKNANTITLEQVEEDFLYVQRNELPNEVRRTPTSRLFMLAQSEETAVGDKCTFWRENYANRLKEEEDADRNEAIRQGTLD